jgi:hypothetical protein
MRRPWPAGGCCAKEEEEKTLKLMSGNKILFLSFPHLFSSFIL